MKTYDLAIAWNWEFDYDFISCLERECAVRGISTYRIDPQNLHDIVRQIEAGELVFKCFFDRASDADPEFLPLVALLTVPGVFAINPHDRVAYTIDKATMHLEFITHGLNVPYTIILPPYNQKKNVEIPSVEFEQLGIPFVIKPANTTGGGTGVVLGARTMRDVLETRQFHKDDKYLLQQKIEPIVLDGKRGWFRVYCLFGEFISCWWDDITHKYRELSPEEEKKFSLGSLRAVIKAVQEICRLDFFSSEIALDGGGKFVLVDYVNEVCDMRLKSKYFNGAPDAVVHRIEKIIAEQLKAHLCTTCK
jgi:hypothetical protein